MEKKVIEVKDKATALEMDDKYAFDSDRNIIDIDWDGYKLVLQKFDKKVYPIKSVPADANLIEETEYIVKADILNIMADNFDIKIEAEFKDGDSFLLYQQTVESNPKSVLDDVIFFEENSEYFKSVEIETDLKTYIEELLEKSEDDE